MIQSKKDLKFYLKEDRKRNIGSISYFRYLIGIIFGEEACCVYRYLKSLRNCEYYTNSSKNILQKFFHYYWTFVKKLLEKKYGIRIDKNVVGYGLRIPHIVGGVIIHCKSMGNYCQANSGVIVGINKTSDNIPIIGNNVQLTVGSKVIGKCLIGDNVAVCPNSVVICDLPDNCVVSGVPAKIIKIDGKRLTFLE